MKKIFMVIIASVLMIPLFSSTSIEAFNKVDGACGKLTKDRILYANMAPDTALQYEGVVCASGGFAKGIPYKDSKYWYYTCKGSFGGTSAACKVPLITTNTNFCGSSHNKTFTAMPTANLCAKGKLNDYFSHKWNDPNFKWLCEDTKEMQECSAFHQLDGGCGLLSTDVLVSYKSTVNAGVLTAEVVRKSDRTKPDVQGQAYTTETLFFNFDPACCAGTYGVQNSVDGTYRCEGIHGGKGVTCGYGSKDTTRKAVCGEWHGKTFPSSSSPLRNITSIEWFDLTTEQKQGLCACGMAMGAGDEAKALPYNQKWQCRQGYMGKGPGAPAECVLYIK